MRNIKGSDDIRQAGKMQPGLFLNMLKQKLPITGKDSITDIVSNDYRAADVFLKYGIQFCCGGKLPLAVVCASRNINMSEAIQDIENSATTIHINGVHFKEWEPTFLADFILHIHHRYLKNTFPIGGEYVQILLNAHKTKYPYLTELKELFDVLHNDTMETMHDEEEIYLPYIKRIAHAHRCREPYGILFTRTLQKPLHVLSLRDESIHEILNQLRHITSEYSPAANACLTHKVSLFKLRQLDNDLRQYLFLKEEILIPKALQIERELSYPKNRP